MQIDFYSPEDFLSEIDSVKDEMDEDVVRVQIEKQEIPKNAFTAYGVRAGFLRNGDLYQFQTEAGISPPRPGDMDGKEQAERIYALITSGVTAMKLKVRKGVFVG